MRYVIYIYIYRISSLFHAQIYPRIYRPIKPRLVIYEEQVVENRRKTLRSKIGRGFVRPVYGERSRSRDLIERKLVMLRSIVCRSKARVITARGRSADRDKSN